jgi:gas vesicle protein
MKKTVENKNHVLRNVVAGAAVVGAGILAAKVLTDENTRKDIKNAMKQVEKKGQEVLSNINDTKDNVIKNIVKEFEDLKAKIENGKLSKDLQKEVDAIGTLITDMQKSNKDDVDELVKQVQSSMKKLKKDVEEVGSDKSIKTTKVTRVKK